MTDASSIGNPLVGVDASVAGQSPLVVLPSRYVAGVEKVDPAGMPFTKEGRHSQPGVVYPDWAAAFYCELPSDAHCLTYVVPGPHPQYRVNKAALAELVGRGLEPILNWILMDVDHPGHTAWRADQVFEAFVDILRRVRTLGELGRTAIVYRRPPARSTPDDPRSVQIGDRSEWHP